jgi:hypothetical protein
MQTIIQQLSSKNTLVITEKNGAIEQGSAINFVVIGDKLKFELSPGNATKYDIKISSKLNEMAYKNILISRGRSKLAMIVPPDQ